MEEAAAEIGDYRGGIDTSAEGDEVRGKYAVWILEKKHPGLLLLHLTALDHIEHETGVFSPESLAIMERLDAVIGSVRAAAESIAPGHAVVAVVSDHGFVNCDQQLNLFPAFRDAKLFTVDEKGKITDWRAMPWVTGGSAAIVLKDPKDAATVTEVRALLTKIADDPASGVNRILDAEELRNRGAYPNASFFVGLKPGWRTGHSLEGPVVSKVKPGGTHGGLPFIVPLRSSFFVVGPNILPGKKLGVIDMIDIAPTLAKEVGLSLPKAEGKPLLP
jgi:predicted AlkP superfamily pyrophosphatase or phosphodiesterase